MTVSVIIPAYNAAELLERALAALSVSRARPAEIIVVDDGSTDASVAVAESRGARVLSMPHRSGPARARNHGARAATGDVLLFLDADVCAAPDTVERVMTAFEDPSLDALIGSYDDDPSSQDFLSQYRNLMHCFVHQNARTEASTFWSGCGAIRRNVFLEYSGFDEAYGRPAIEDIELGYRLVEGGRRIILDRELRVKHLKQWSFWGLVKTDVMDRGIPWTELILRDQRMPNDLNVQLSQRVSVALVYVALTLAALSAVRWHAYFLTPLLAMLFLLLSRYWTEGSRSQGWWPKGLLAGGVTIFSVVAFYTHMMGLIPLVVLSIPALLLRHRYEKRPGKRNFLSRAGAGLCMVAGLAVILYYLPTRPDTLGLGAVLLIVLILNSQFYVFLAGKRGAWFALAAIPFHLLYHLYNGLSFIIGFTRWALRGGNWDRTRRAAAASRTGR